MFKKYKIRKEKEKTRFKINAKKINIKDTQEEKCEIYKLKILFYNKNKKNAFKRIINLPKQIFAENIYFITINVFSEALNEFNPLVKECLKKIANAEKFYMVEEIVIQYLNNFRNNNEVLDLFKRKFTILKDINNLVIDVKKPIKSTKISYDKQVQLLR